ncbi:MAG TPA: hypothetical protein VH986_14815 [Acidimicrobiia bacterium]|jgi:predicted Co/Zn/Cd cation transporter (cation efflux family)
MFRHVRLLAATALSVLALVALLAVPAGAQQLVDAGKEGDGSGGLAFVLFTLMVVCCAGAMFFMDHVRRRRVREEEDQKS